MYTKILIFVFMNRIIGITSPRVKSGDNQWMSNYLPCYVAHIGQHWWTWYPGIRQTLQQVRACAKDGNQSHVWKKIFNWNEFMGKSLMWKKKSLVGWGAVFEAFNIFKNEKNLPHCTCDWVRRRVIDEGAILDELRHVCVVETEALPGVPNVLSTQAVHVGFDFEPEDPPAFQHFGLRPEIDQIDWRVCRVLTCSRIEQSSAGGEFARSVSGVSGEAGKDAVSNVLPRSPNRTRSLVRPAARVVGKLRIDEIKRCRPHPVLFVRVVAVQPVKDQRRPVA